MAAQVVDQVYLVGPSDVVARYAGGTFRRTPTSDGLSIGQPLYEPADVPNPRGCVSHGMTGAQVAYALAVVARNGHAAVVSIADTFPADWRWPAPRIAGSSR